MPCCGMNCSARTRRRHFESCTQRATVAQTVEKPARAQASAGFVLLAMPIAPPKPCVKCGALVRDGSSRCQAHKVRDGSFADRRRGSRHERGYGTTWDKTRERIMRRDGGLCQPSLRHGLIVFASHVDHIVPKAQGGTDDDDNLQAISAHVHAAKTAAERAGNRWDEDQWFANNPRGLKKWAAARLRTDPASQFLAAGVSGGGVVVDAVGGA